MNWAALCTLARTCQYGSRPVLPMETFSSLLK